MIKKPPLRNRFRFRKDDPMRDLHVPRSQRLDEDEGDVADTGIDPMGDADDDFDRDEVRNRGDVVPEEDLR